MPLILRALLQQFKVLDLTLQLHHAQRQLAIANAECAAIEAEPWLDHDERMPDCAVDAQYWHSQVAHITERRRVARAVLLNTQLQRRLLA